MSQTEEQLRDRFREFAEQHFGCGAMNPANIRDACCRPYRHEGPHSWQVAVVDDFSDPATEQVREQDRWRVGTWTKIKGEWCVRIASSATGDTVRVRSKSGEITEVILGHHLGRCVYLCAETLSHVEQT